MNYQLEMHKIIKSMTSNKLLLHSCCAPCSSSVIETLKPYFDITVLYYNPNIEPAEEYEKRKKVQIDYLNKINIKYLDIDYNHQDFKAKIKGFEKEPENGIRCHICYELRLSKTAHLAQNYNFDYFCTTLTVSPHKNSQIVNQIGLNIESKYKIKYLLSDFKKSNGYQRSIELSKTNELYRQDYCGCLYSKGEEYEK